MARFVAVTPNPAVDVTYRVDRQLIGETVRVRDVARRAGGKGVNVARVLHALGRDVVAVAPLGGDAGEGLGRELTADGIPVRATPIDGDTRFTIAVVDDIAHPTLLAEPGPAWTTSLWEALCGAVGDVVGQDDWVVIAGSFPPGTPPDATATLVGAARSRGARVVVDTSGPHLLAAADAGADVVKANAEEVRTATGCADVRDAAVRLAARGALVVVSLGADGLLVRDPDGTVSRHPAVAEVAGNPTGAGDAATAGLVAALSDGRDIGTAAGWAAVAGAAAVLHPLAGAVDPADLLTLAHRADVDVRGLLSPSHPLWSSS
ncbi:hexose kinase [Microbacterium sp. 1P10UB]|uniref:1-phosphofructokinase family hexose kinase n=1 Tax=unclassified Microbacterium TaxID=2609290 RepID=UPI0039A01D57